MSEFVDPYQYLGEFDLDTWVSNVPCYCEWLNEDVDKPIYMYKLKQEKTSNNTTLMYIGRDRDTQHKFHQFMHVKYVITKNNNTIEHIEYEIPKGLYYSTGSLPYPLVMKKQVLWFFRGRIFDPIRWFDIVSREKETNKEHISNLAKDVVWLSQYGVSEEQYIIIKLKHG